ncbi:MAG: zinc-ribbon domain-containing protein [Clostridia bacterium]|nr:zinc-ribbon domain-containing protein [Clostridia bacterium]
MAFCGKCGAQIEENAKFCPSCGAPTEAPAVEQAAPAQEAPQQAAPEQKNDFSAKISALNDTADTTAEFEQEDIDKNKVMAILAYLSWLVLIPLLAAKDSKFARFHTNQGLVLAIAEVIWGVAYSIVSAILGAIHLGFIASILGLVSILFLVLTIIGIINAANGKAKELPVVGKFKILK